VKALYQIKLLQFFDTKISSQSLEKLRLGESKLLNSLHNQVPKAKRHSVLTDSFGVRTGSPGEATSLSPSPTGENYFSELSVLKSIRQVVETYWNRLCLKLYNFYPEAFVVVE